LNSGDPLFFFNQGDLDEAEKILPRYFTVRRKKAGAKFLLAKTVSSWITAGEFQDADTESLWDAHQQGIAQLDEIIGEEPPYQKFSERKKKYPSLMDIKTELARRIFSKCSICEHRCGIDRNEQRGWCGVGGPRLSSEFLHMGEEPELIPSHTFFFSGCTFRCVFCQNWDISQDPDEGIPVNVEEVIHRIRNKSGRSANVNWVGGDPTPNLPFILSVLARMEMNKAQVWNSNMYLSEMSMSLLDGIMDLYLTDFKYGNNRCGKRLSKVDDYWDIVRRNHMEAARQGEMIIRHLVLPDHLDCCTFPILRFIADELDKTRLRVNIMGQYRPEYKAGDFEEIRRRPRNEEMEKAIGYARELGISLCD